MRPQWITTVRGDRPLKEQHPNRSHVPLGGVVAAAAFSNDSPATDSGLTGGLNTNRLPAGSTVSFPTKGGLCSSARVRIRS